MPLIKFSKFMQGILVTIVVLAAYFRLQSAIHGTFAYTYDIGRDLLGVSDIVLHHHFSLIGPTTGLPGIFYGPWWYWILIIPDIVSNGNPQGIDAFMGITGILTVVIGYFVGKRLRDSWTGILFASLLGFSTILIGISSQIWNPNLAPFALILITLLFLQIDGEKNKNIQSIYFFCVGAIVALTFDSFEIVYGLIQTISIALFFFLILKRTLSIKNILTAIVGIALIEIPRVIFEARHHFLMTKVLVASIVQNGHKGGMLLGISQLQNVLFVLWQQWVLAIFPNGIISAVLLVGTCATTIFLFRNRLFNEKEKKLMYFCIIYILTYIVILSFFNGTVWNHFVVGAPIVIVLFFYLNVSVLLKHIASNYKKYFPFALCSVVIFTLVTIVQNTLSSQMALPNDPAIYNNQLGVIKYIYQQSGNQMFMYDVYTPPIHPYTYQYLFSWYGNKKNLLNQQAKLEFLVIEPDASHPSLRAAWLQLHDGETKGINEHTLPGNILVQTRLRK